MSTHGIIGYISRDGYGAATYVHHDGYPDRTGAALLNHWQDTEVVKALVAGGRIRTILSCTDLSEIEYIEGPGRQYYPVELTPVETPFFERDWWKTSHAAFAYLLTPDGWFGMKVGTVDLVFTDDGDIDLPRLPNGDPQPVANMLRLFPEY